jgi:type IV pilus assembly protein PilB
MGIRQNLKRLSERKKLGELLLETGLLTPEQLKAALERSSKNNVLLGTFLVSEGLVSEEDMAQTLARQFGFPSIDLRRVENCPPEALKLIPEQMARKYKMVPVGLEGDALVIAVHDPQTLVNLNSIPELAGRRVRAAVAPESQVPSAIDRFYKGQSDTKLIEMIATNIQQRTEAVAPKPAKVATLREVSGERVFSIENLLNKIIDSAIDRKASDLHFEPLKTEVRVRQRVDGILQPAQTLPIDIFPSLISRIKILAQMDISEKRQPQDGHFQVRVGQRDVDFRVSTLPTVHGEKAVIRILDKNAQRASLDETGMGPELQEHIRLMLKRPYGMILVTGPTGSGKTTTVYSMIREINDLKLNIVTIEDPVEFEIDDVNQVQVNPKANVLFANTLRSVLRQDPDVIMVGEIRDQETAEIAIRSALTGHLVISTLHTNNSAGTLTRLVEMGVEPFLVSSSVLGVLSQRLVRKLCPHCREAYEITQGERDLLGAELVPAGSKVYRPRGCESCDHTGFSGRLGIFELLEPDAEVRRLVSAGQFDEPVLAHLAAIHFRTMRVDGVEKVLQGLTSVDEVVSETL